MNINYEDGTESYGNRRWHEEDSPWKAQKIDQILRRNKITPKSVCEIGCGAGEVLHSLASYFDESVIFSGYETSKEAFEICKRKEQQNINYFLKNLLKEDAYFDIVLAIDVFTQITDYLGFLSKLRLKGEYKVFHIPLEMSVYSVLRSYSFQKKQTNGSQLHYFNKDTALGTLIGTGYQIVDHFYTSGALELPNRGRKENLWKLPRKLVYSINKDIGAKMFGGFSLLVLAK